MIPYPEFSPEILRIGPLAIRWYGMMYLLGFLCAYLSIRKLVSWHRFPLDKDGIADYLTAGVFGVVIGGRLGYALFYNASHYLQHPLEVFAVWKGGMSFHGGLLGVVVASIWYAKRRGLPVLAFGDILVAASPFGLGFGRIGNFINAELWGRVTDHPFGMIFPGGGPLPRHPSQLYEALLEGVLLAAVLWFLHYRRVRTGIPFFSFFLGYGICRFLVEYVREPDVHIGLMAGWISRGQLLSLPMIIFGIVGILWVLRKRGRDA